MVVGVFTSSPYAVRRPVHHPPADMTEREALALTHLLVQRRLEAARALDPGDQQQPAAKPVGSCG